jgi:hypothetical protein
LGHILSDFYTNSSGHHEGEKKAGCKSRPKCGPINLFVKIKTELIHWGKEVNEFALLVIFKKLLKENNRSMGENPPNLVTSVGR